MILVCGGLADSVTQLVCARLERMYPYRLLNLGLYPNGYSVSWTWQGGVPTGTITAPDWTLALDQISGVFVRYVEGPSHAPFATLQADLEPAVLAECQAGLGAVLEHIACPVANRFAGSSSNHSKPYQALLIRQAGLATPRTLITSDPEAAHAFYDACAGEVIFKSLSGVRSIVRRMESHDLARLHLLQHGAAQFQECLPGDNIRVHTVGDQLFATRIRSTAVDYRYAHQQGGDASLEATSLPVEVAAACYRLANTLGLVIAGIDLKQTPDGQWYCFEINPAPGFSFYETRTGQPISAALADLLHRGSIATT